MSLRIDRLVKLLAGVLAAVILHPVVAQEKQDGLKNVQEFKGEAKLSIHKIKMEKGNTYRLSVTATDFEPTLQIFNKSGPVTQSSARGNEAQLIFTPSATEEYQVRVDRSAESKVGAEPKPYTLTVEKATFAQESAAKDQLKVNEHSANFKADKVYFVTVKGKDFSPTFLILDGDKVVARKGIRSGLGGFSIGPGGGIRMGADWVVEIRGNPGPAAPTLFIPERSASYRIVVNAPSNAKPGEGAMDYTVTVAEAKTELVARDRLASDDPLYAVRKSRHKVHTVKLQADKTYQIDLMSKAFDAYLYLEDSAQKVLKEDDDSGDGLNARIIFRPTRTDTYRIIATAFGPKGEGAYSLSVIENSNAQPAGLPGIRLDPEPLPPPPAPPGGLPPSPRGSCS